MASRFIKVRKIVIPFISLVILTSQLVGCASLNSEELESELREASTIEIDIGDIDKQATQEQETIEVDGQQYEVDTPEVIDLKEVVTHEELLAYFQTVYDTTQQIFEPGEFTLEQLIESELISIEGMVASDNKTLPADYESQYRAWRPVETTEPETQAEVTIPATTYTKIEKEPEVQETPQQAKPTSSGQSGTNQSGISSTPSSGQSSDSPFDTVGTPFDNIQRPNEGLSEEEKQQRLEAATQNLENPIDAIRG